MRDIRDGVGQSGVRAGVIGEVGCSWPLTPNERKVLRASGRAQRRTGAPLLIHPGRDEGAPFEIVEVLRDVDADLPRTIIGHIERTLIQRANMKKLAESGCVLEFDLFGREHSYYKHSPSIDMINDAERLRLLAWLISEGHGRQLVLAQDTAAKTHLVRYGGCGYGHILQNIVPRMRLARHPRAGHPHDARRDAGPRARVRTRARLRRGGSPGGEPCCALAAASARPRPETSQAGARASRIACHTRSGVAGMSRWRTPSGASASITAFITAGRAPTVPASPAPLAPSRLAAVGTGLLPMTRSGSVSARGIA